MSLFDIAVSVVIVGISVVLSLVASRLMKTYLTKYVAKTRTPIDDIIVKKVKLPLVVTVILIGVNIALRRLDIFAPVTGVFDTGLFIFWTILVAYLSYRIIESAISVFADKAGLRATPIQLLRRGSRWLITIITIVVIAGLVGFDLGGVVPTLMLVLGTIIFLGLAVWSIFGNVTGGLVLMIWRPFEVGDYVELGPDGFAGQVMDVNLMFCKLKTANDEVLNIPNTLVLQKSIRNFSTSGRIMFTTQYRARRSVDYEETEKMLVNATLNTPRILKEPAPYVTVKDIQDESVLYEINAYTSSPGELSKTRSMILNNILKIEEPGREQQEKITPKDQGKD